MTKAQAQPEFSRCRRASPARSVRPQSNTPCAPARDAHPCPPQRLAIGPTRLVCNGDRPDEKLPSEGATSVYFGGRPQRSGARRFSMSQLGAGAPARRRRRLNALVRASCWPSRPERGWL